MKLHMLKYGLVVLTIIAGSGLMWADCDVEIIHDTCIIEKDTCIIEKIDSLCTINISGEQVVKTCFQKKPQEEVSCWVSMLSFVKEYKKDIVFLFSFIAFILIGIVAAIFKWGKKDTTSPCYERIRLSFVITGVFTLCAFSDSSWAYLVLVAIVLMYMNRENPELLEKVGNAMSVLHGKNIHTDLGTPSEREKKRLEEAMAAESGVAQETSSKKQTTQKSPKAYMSRDMQKYINAEDRIIQMLSEQYPNLETGRVVEMNGERVLLDGLVQGAHENLIIEIRYLRDPMRIRSITGLHELLNVREYIQTKSHKPTYVGIYVVTDSEEKKEQMIEMSKTPYVVLSLSRYTQITVYTFREIDEILSRKSMIKKSK